jgi:hypothetical protein
MQLFLLEEVFQNTTVQDHCWKWQLYIRDFTNNPTKNCTNEGICVNEVLRVLKVIRKPLGVALCADFYESISV